VTATFTELRAVAVPINRSCTLLGRARATHCRHVRGPVHGPRPARAVPENGQALSAAERAAVLTLINTPAYTDLSIGQIWGTADAIDQERQNTLTAADHAHPERFGPRPHPPVMPTQFWINQPETEPQMN